ncbi:hypothetical protein Bca52824_035197 [Brassica carinata]|uniref:Uncharacterized protein n=1 Tax=Brassica carinata TaxID=52824 RepID=A0A8X7V0B2_BRACI|nr:hypothetical protein Bca52824_035197 [Brassica carinata]
MGSRGEVVEVCDERLVGAVFDGDAVRSWRVGSSEDERQGDCHGDARSASPKSAILVEFSSLIVAASSSPGTIPGSSMRPSKQREGMELIHDTCSLERKEAELVDDEHSLGREGEMELVRDDQQKKIFRRLRDSSEVELVDPSLVVPFGKEKQIVDAADDGLDLDEQGLCFLLEKELVDGHGLQPPGVMEFSSGPVSERRDESNLGREIELVAETTLSDIQLLKEHRGDERRPDSFLTVADSLAANLLSLVVSTGLVCEETIQSFGGLSMKDRFAAATRDFVERENVAKDSSSSLPASGFFEEDGNENKVVAETEVERVVEDEYDGAGDRDAQEGACGGDDSDGYDDLLVSDASAGDTSAVKGESFDFSYPPSAHHSCSTDSIDVYRHTVGVPFASGFKECVVYFESIDVQDWKFFVDRPRVCRCIPFIASGGSNAGLAEPGLDTMSAVPAAGVFGVIAGSEPSGDRRREGGSSSGKVIAAVSGKKIDRQATLVGNGNDSKKRSADVCLSKEASSSKLRRVTKEAPLVDGALAISAEQEKVLFQPFQCAFGGRVSDCASLFEKFRMEDEEEDDQFDAFEGSDWYQKHARAMVTSEKFVNQFVKAELEKENAKLGAAKDGSDHAGEVMTWRKKYDAERKVSLAAQKEVEDHTKKIALEAERVKKRQELEADRLEDAVSERVAKEEARRREDAALRRPSERGGGARLVVGREGAARLCFQDLADVDLFGVVAMFL